MILKDRTKSRPLRDALHRLKAALLDLKQAGQHGAAADVAAIIRRLES